MHLLTPDQAASRITLELVVRSGLLRRAARDVEVVPGAWRGSASVDGRRFTVEVALEAASLRPVEAADAGAVEAAASRLDAHRHRELRWSGAGTLPDGGRGEVPVEGQLTVRGVTRPVALRAAVEERGDLVTGVGELTVAQTSFGVRPWAAFLSGVEVGDEVRVRFRVAFRRVGRSGD